MEKKRSCWARFCGFLLRKMGWTTVGGPAPEAKCVILGVPHTSAWDFVISYLFYTQFDKTAHVMIKKEFFKWPVGAFLRKVGCIPVDRSSASAMLFSLINEMEKVDTFHHMIAKKVGCPVYMGYFDWKTKCVSIGKKVELTDDARADTDRIQALYEEMHMRGKNPEGYVTH